MGVDCLGEIDAIVDDENTARSVGQVLHRLTPPVEVVALGMLVPELHDASAAGKGGTGDLLMAPAQETASGP